MKKYILVGLNSYTTKLLTLIPPDDIAFIMDKNNAGKELQYKVGETVYSKKIYGNINPSDLPQVLELFEFVLVHYGRADIDLLRQNNIPFVFAPELLLRLGVYNLGTHQYPNPDIYPYPIKELMNTYGRNEFSPVGESEYKDFCQMADKYEKIIIGVMHPTSIGGFAWTSGRICEYMEMTKGDKVLQAVCKGWHPLMETVKKYDVPNEFIYKKMKEAFPAINANNVNLWCNYICRNMDKLNVIDYTGALQLTKRQSHAFFSTPGLIIPKAKPPVERLSFAMEEQQKGEKLAHEMGILRKYVCFFSRDNAYVKTTHNNITNASYNAADKYRNSNINEFRLMATNLQKRGIQSVRMGSIVADKYTGDGVDYSNINQSDFMDAYLFAHCMFFVADTSGINLIATELFSKPMVAIHTPTALVFHGDVAGLYHILLFRKVFDNKLGRNLTLREILHPCNELNYYIYNITPYWEQRDIAIIPVTKEEIWEATEEMLNILNGTQRYSSEDMEMRERYRRIINEHLQKSPEFDADQGYPSIAWLRKNQWFLA